MLKNALLGLVLAAMLAGCASLTKPWIAPEDWIPNHPDMTVVDEEDYKLARIAVSEPSLHSPFRPTLHSPMILG